MPLYYPSTTGMANDTTCPRLLTMLPLVLMIRMASSRTLGGTESSTIRVNFNADDDIAIRVKVNAHNGFAAYS